MTKKQEAKAVTSFLIRKAQETAKEALSDGVSKEKREYLITKSVIIRDLLKEENDEKNNN